MRRRRCSSSACSPPTSRPSPAGSPLCGCAGGNTCKRGGHEQVIPWDRHSPKMNDIIKLHLELHQDHFRIIGSGMKAALLRDDLEGCPDEADLGELWRVIIGKEAVAAGRAAGGHSAPVQEEAAMEE